MSIPMQLLKDTVGNLRRLLEDVFDVVEENLFPRSLMGTTIQDGSTRERKDDKRTQQSFKYKVSKIMKNENEN